MPIDLATLSNAAVWLRAKDNGPNGSSVSTWIDNLGLHNGVSAGQIAPQVVDGATPVGGKAISFAGSSFFDLGSVLNNSVTAPNQQEAWIVVKAQLGNTPNPNGLWRWANSYSYNAYPISATDDYGIYEQFCTTSYEYQYTSGTRLNNTWRIYRVTFSNGTITQYLDNVQTSSIGGFTQDLATNVLLGRSSYSTLLYNFYGQVAEVFARNEVSSDATALEIFNYLNGEHILARVSGMAPVKVNSRYNTGVIAELTGIAPVSVSASSLSSSVSTVSGTAPVDVQTSSLFVVNFSPYTTESSELIISVELSGTMDPLFPPPVPPVNFAGLPDPATAPTVTKSTTSGGLLTPGLYRYSYAAWKGTKAQVTAPSPTLDVNITTENTVHISFPTIAGADGYLVYREDL